MDARLKRCFLSDDLLEVLFFLRGSELLRSGRSWEMQTRNIHARARPLMRMGLVSNYNHANVWSADPHAKLSKEGRALAKAIIEYEEENPRYSAEEGPSSIFHGGALYQWSHLTAVREIENLRLLRQRKEEQKAKRSGKRGCHETRCIAAPRPKVAICNHGGRDKCRV